MASGILEEVNIPSLTGFRLATTACGLKVSGAKDLLLVAMEQPCSVAGLFTRNQVRAAPVTLCQQRLVQGTARALLVNSGNANVANGPQGMTAALSSTQAVADGLAIEPATVFVASTGVIGQHFPVDKIETALPALIGNLQPADWWQAARAIMTTDTFPKACHRQIRLAEGVVNVVGIAKGAGMIHPDMATMLAFIFTDAKIAAPQLQKWLNQAVQESFNSITVDGDTSTNDTVLAFASGSSGCTVTPSEGGESFLHALTEVCATLAQAIVRDGEGATRFITITVSGATSHAAARQVAKAIAHSPLVKTAFYGGDPNWGRILAAVGYAGVPLQVERLAIALDTLKVVEGGLRHPDYSEAVGAQIMARKEIPLFVDLGAGSGRATIWTCDLSHEYITINADYTT
ncbi:MAG: bifunctional glutamate N-acetyltransferase/amino-acid acetyltransferase ArgJ [Magnetococcales bacterium]|nr:bifunctional glutamate N-acetyltransferase/amino-acid acetyltransferase ArgJ [Magnetococcales bacterium]NGZ27033.1 bifunctional glutamate N-acetyltransferase/amino-acid acetyltransferase ArgJ [Magnetococcales bacterium]